MRLMHLYPRFCRNRTTWFGSPLQHDDHTLGAYLFSTLPWEDTDWWNDANIKSAFKYLRGAHGLWLGNMRALVPNRAVTYLECMRVNQACFMHLK